MTTNSFYLLWALFQGLSLGFALYMLDPYFGMYDNFSC